MGGNAQCVPPQLEFTAVRVTAEQEWPKIVQVKVPVLSGQQEGGDEDAETVRAIQAEQQRRFVAMSQLVASPRQFQTSKVKETVQDFLSKGVDMLGAFGPAFYIRNFGMTVVLLRQHNFQ